MTGDSRAAPTRFPTTSWVFVGTVIVAFFGLVAYSGQDSVAAGFLMGGTSAILVLGALGLWLRAQEVHPVPAAEYLAVVWLLSYVALGAIDAFAAGKLPPTDWLVLFPPLSFLPPTLRRLFGDNGDPRSRARTVAYYLHMVLGVLFCGLAVLFILTVILIIAAPLPLVPGVMHLRAGFIYRQERGTKA